MHAILATVGTDGDILPYVALGKTLRARGHRVTLVANGRFEALATSLGFDYRALLPEEESEALLADPDFWHPIKGVKIAARWVTPHIESQFTLLSELADDDDAVLVSSPAIVSARLVHETRGTPLATVVIQPWMIPSISAPPIMPGGFTLPRGAPRWVGELYWRLIDVAGWRVLGRHLNAVRVSMGLARVRRVFRWMYSPDLIIGMFPDWFGRPQADWPSQTKPTGFPLYDGQAGLELSPEIQQFLDAGEPPIVFTFGTGMMHGAPMFREAVEVCRALGIRGLLLTKYPRQLPDELPRTVATFHSTPFLRLFPRCAAVVHHGGIGTVVKALKSGTPQLIRPLAYDQFDNALRVKKLGAGDTLKSGRVSTARIASALAAVMSDETRTSCRRVAERFEGGEDPLEKAAKLVEELAAQRRAGALAW